MNRGAEHAFREWRFLQLTLCMCAWMLLAPRMQERWIAHVLMQVLLVNLVVVTLWVNPNWQRLRSPMIALWIVSLAGSLVAFLPLAPAWQRLGKTAEIVSLVPVFVLLAVGILRFVFGQRHLTPDGILATVAVYLIIAFLFAQVYLLALAWNPGSFQLPVPAADRAPQLLQSDMVYFSLVTLATVGYGDILPHSEMARALANIEAVIGQFYVAVIVAVFVGMYAAKQNEQPPG